MRDGVLLRERWCYARWGASERGGDFVLCVLAGAHELLVLDRVGDSDAFTLTLMRFRQRGCV